MKLPPGYVPGSGAHKATAYGGFGEKLLKQMGWQEGQGLGRDKKGMKKAIVVKLKDDTVGIGGKTTFAWEKKWWEEAYDSKAKQLQVAGTDSDSDNSDDDFVIDVNRDGTRSSAHAHERKIAAALAKDPWGRFGGRDGKMARIARQEAEQLARLRAGQGASTNQPDSHTAAAAAAAILAASGALAAVRTPSGSGAEGKEQTGKKKKGKRKQYEDEAANAQEEALPQMKRRRKRREAAAAPGLGDSLVEGAQQQDTVEAGKASTKSSKSARSAAGAAGEACTHSETAVGTPGARAESAAAAGGAAAAPRRRVHIVRVAEDSSRDTLKATPAAGWWGASRFRPAGCLEGLEHTAEHVQRQRQSFTEQTQEDLYTATQAAKATAKKGLGTASAPRKVAGTRWQGTKQVFDEEEEAGAAPHSSAGAAEGPSKQPEGAAAAKEELPLQSVKWKKLTKAALLEAVDRSMARKRLSQVVVKAALANEGVSASKATRKALQDVMLAKVSSSSMFAVEGDVVRLL